MAGVVLVSAAAAGTAVSLVVARPAAGVWRWADLQAGGVRRDRVAGSGAGGQGFVTVVGCAAVAAVAVAVAEGPLAGLLVVGGAALLRDQAAARTAAAARRQEWETAGQALAVLGAELRGGRSPTEALQVAADAAAEGQSCAFGDRLAAAAALARLGGDIAPALVGPGEPSAVADVSVGLALCWRVCTTSGAGLAAAVERLQDSLRARSELARVVEAELAGPRASAALLALLPVVGVLLAAALGADPVHTLLHTVVGGCCLVGGLGLDLLGWRWTRRLVRRAGG